MPGRSSPSPISTWFHKLPPPAPRLWRPVRVGLHGTDAGAVNAPLRLGISRLVYNEDLKCGVMLSINHVWKEGSMTALIETMPKMDLAIHAIEHLVEELRAYHAISSPLFQRREPREAAHTYLQRLLAPLPRPSIEPMVLAVAGSLPRRTGHAVLSQCRAWHDEQLLHQPWQAVATALGADDGVLMVDGSASAAGRPFGGRAAAVLWGVGQRANCQAGVWWARQPPGLHLAGSSVVYARGGLTDDPDTERRRPCGIPAAITFKTKPALAQERSPPWCSPSACGVAGSWQPRRLGTTRAFWRG